MAKKKQETNWVIYGLIIIVMLILFKSNSNVISESKQFVEKEKLGTSLASNLGTQVSDEKNLCSLISPYVIVFNLQSLCVNNGGMWICNKDNIGCYTMSPLIDCNLAVIKTALNQCSLSGGKPYCNSQTVYCKK